MVKEAFEFKIGYQREAEDYTDTTNNKHEGYTGSGYADIASTVEFPISLTMTIFPKGAV